MKKFRYRLEPLLKVKTHLERERQKELAVAQTQVRQQEDQLTAVDRQRAATLERQRERLAGRLSVAELLIHARYLLRLKGEMLTGQEILRGLRSQAEERRRLLVEAARERKKYERLKEKQLERHFKELSALERKQVEEVAITAHRRKG